VREIVRVREVPTRRRPLLVRGTDQDPVSSNTRYLRPRRNTARLLARRRARKTKADRLFWFDEVPGKALYEGKFNAPMLWNSNFFITLESMKILRLLTDVWLPDFKFGPGRCAMALAKTPWYWETVTRNLGLIAEWGEDYSIRHLVMPNHVECCTYPVLGWIAEAYTWSAD
jgi:hypothetical protein